ncbi:peptidoglycan DD-metalloendopeptidase family protein [uncultured Brevundimonas sp.]|uniref:murein hydrolase activator EnvC family protein n=1 Tax=uncultured Brevundimonas sp. TaxID=213418 RepID=UPI0025ECDB9A|nr:peptidoglycan DD-metalloendopeptidase family protein [uncultured Brevundimonas sp.]
MRTGGLLRVAGVAALALAAATPAASRRAPQSELARLQAEYRDEAVRAQRLRADAEAALSELRDLEERLAELRREASAEDVQLEAQRARLRELSDREGRLVGELSRERGRQGRLLSALQMMSRRPPPPLLVPADKAVDTVRAAILIKAVAPELQSRAKALSEQQAEIGRIRRLAVLSSERLLTTESAQGDRRAEIESLLARKTALSAVLRAEAQTAERAAQVLEDRIRALGGRVDVPAPAAQVQTASRPAGGARLSPPLSAEPVERFGNGSSGWRWRADRATAGAPATSRVAYAGPLGGWGQVVILDLGPGWRAVVAGLETLDVQAGQRVAGGETLGRSARNGQVYFELRRDERPIDPRPWLQ